MGQRRDNKAKFCMYEAAELPAGRSDVASRAPTTRSRITNGKQMLAGIDGRSAEARRYRDLAMSFADDLGGRRS
jgi:hypothetical protein